MMSSAQLKIIEQLNQGNVAHVSEVVCQVSYQNERVVEKRRSISLALKMFHLLGD